jgi:glutamate-1-semialdehyde aminotransferase
MVDRNDKDRGHETGNAQALSTSMVLAAALTQINRTATHALLLEVVQHLDEQGQSLQEKIDAAVEKLRLELRADIENTVARLVEQKLASPQKVPAAKKRTPKAKDPAKPKKATRTTTP